MTIEKRTVQVPTEKKFVACDREGCTNAEELLGQRGEGYVPTGWDSVYVCADSRRAYLCPACIARAVSA